MPITQNVTLQTSGGLVPTIVHMKQYENSSRQITCAVLKDGIALTGLDDSVVEVSCTKPNGSTTSYRSDEDADIVQVSDSEIAFLITNDMADRAGKFLFDVTLVGDNSERLGLFQIVFNVDTSTYEGGGITYSSLTAYTHEQLTAYTHAQIESGEVV